MITLKSKWSNFARLVFDPWIIVLILITIALGYSLIIQTDPKVITALALIFSLVSGTLGGICAMRWRDLVEEKVIVARGTSAVRQLKLLFRNITALEKRVRVYLTRHEKTIRDDQNDNDIYKTYLEDVIRQCVVLEEECF